VVETTQREFYYMYSSLNFIRMIKPRKIRYVGQVVLMEKERSIQDFGKEF
jgi:hypothetical protein